MTRTPPLPPWLPRAAVVSSALARCDVPTRQNLGLEIEPLERAWDDLRGVGHVQDAWYACRLEGQDHAPHNVDLLRGIEDGRVRDHAT